jgi:L-fucose mutarotase
MADAERGETSEQRNSAVLKGLDPILGPELLSALRCMGHGDEIALVDANFPASSLGVPVIRLDGASVTRALDAVLSVLPLDDFVPEATWRMQVVDQADQEIPIFAEFREIIARRAGPHVRLASLERFAFYERTRGASGWWGRARTGYGNILLKKGVVRPWRRCRSTRRRRRPNWRGQHICGGKSPRVLVPALSH